MKIVHITQFYHSVIGNVKEVVKKATEYMASKRERALRRDI